MTKLIKAVSPCTEFEAILTRLYAYAAHPGAENYDVLINDTYEFLTRQMQQKEVMIGRVRKLTRKGMFYKYRHMPYVLQAGKESARRLSDWMEGHRADILNRKIYVTVCSDDQRPSAFNVLPALEEVNEILLKSDWEANDWFVVGRYLEHLGLRVLDGPGLMNFKKDFVTEIGRPDLFGLVYCVDDHPWEVKVAFLNANGYFDDFSIEDAEWVFRQALAKTLNKEIAPLPAAEHQTVKPAMERPERLHPTTSSSDFYGTACKTVAMGLKQMFSLPHECTLDPRVCIGTVVELLHALGDRNQADEVTYQIQKAHDGTWFIAISVYGQLIMFNYNPVTQTVDDYDPQVLSELLVLICNVILKFS